MSTIKNDQRASVKRFACAIFRFSPSIDEELNLDIGEVVEVTGDVDDFWLNGVKLHSNESGQFPKEFVKDIQLPNCSASETLLYALDAFYPEAEDDLPFEKGAIIVLEQTIDSSWGRGRCAGCCGMFPLNFTDRLLPLTIPTNAADISKSDNHLSQKIIQPSEGLGRARATMSLTAQLDEELSFVVGDEVVILEVMDNGSWYRGRLGSDIGTFPASFVQLLSPLKTNKAKPPVSDKPTNKYLMNRTGNRHLSNESSPVNITNNNNNTHLQYKTRANAVAAMRGQPQLSESNKSSVNKVSSKTVDANTDATKSTDNKVNKKVSYTVTALHNFTGKTKEELSFKKGQAISITEEVDEHWLLGKIDSFEGFVARAYVSSDEPDRVSEIASKSLSNGSDKTENLQSSSQNYVKEAVSKISKKHHFYSGTGGNNRSIETPMKPTKQNNEMSNVLVLYTYHSQTQHEVSVTKGDSVHLLREVDENWCEVHSNDGNVGLIPTSYLQMPAKGPSETLSESQKELENDEKQFKKDERNVSHNSTVHTNSSQSAAMQKYQSLATAQHSTSYLSPTVSSAMPSLPEGAAADSHVDKPTVKLHRQFVFTGPKPWGWEKQQGVKSNGVPPSTTSNPNQGSEEALKKQRPFQMLKKSISADSARSEDASVLRINRSNSNPRSGNAQNELRAWQNSRKTRRMEGHQPSTPPNEIFGHTRTNPSVSSPFNRSASMREQRMRRGMDEDRHNDINFVKIKSDSDLSVDAVKGKQRPRDGTMPGKHSASYASVMKSANVDFFMRTHNRDSASTGSSESVSSFGDSRTSHSTYSDASAPDTMVTTVRRARRATDGRIIYRSAPPVPPHSSVKRKSSLPAVTSPEVNYPPSPWSPPVPRRKQSLHRDSTRSETSSQHSDETYFTGKPITQIIPARPAPGIPSGRDIVHRSIHTIEPAELGVEPQKKVPPMRPANPPTAGRNSTMKKKTVTSRDTKEKMEKIRGDIEEYSRMKKDLENLYQGTLDGKERKEISENMEFVKANLRRLQKEFQDLITNQDDHIYESIETHVKVPLGSEPVNEERYISLFSPPLPIQPDSPGQIRQKRHEKRTLVINEIVNTERDFLVGLTVTIEDIMYELVDKEVVALSIISTLFGNIEQVKEFSENLLRDLEQALQNESNSSEHNDLANSMTVGQAFIDNISKMKEVYMTYCRNHDDSIAALEKYENDPEFQLAVSDCLTTVKSKVNVFDLGSFLIKPVQRVLKYPLLINELVKLTDPPTGSEPSDLENLTKAAKLMNAVANDINEDKRTKDLVRKYKNVNNEGLSEKLGKISIKSLKKKSTRISRRIGHVTGLAAHETRDKHFDEIEKRFKNLERALKMFTSNVTSYCDRYREILSAQVSVAKAMVDLVYMPERSHPVSQSQTALERMCGALYRHFHNQVQLRVLSQVSTLLSSFKGPQAIVDKRYDKLLDYEQLQKNPDSKEKLQAAKNVYEALNNSLLDELPTFCDLGLRVLSSCIAIFLQIHKDFERKLLVELKPILKMILQSEGEEIRIPDNFEVIDRFNPAHAEAMHIISRLQIVPASFGALLGSHKDSSETQRKKSSVIRQQQSKQTLEERQSLQQKYSSDKLYFAAHSYTVSHLMDTSCCQGDLIAVLKKQDPMGNKERWFVNNGSETGFLPASILRQNTATSPSEPSNPTSPVQTIKIPIPVPRSPTSVASPRSPALSIRSASSCDSSGTSGGSKAPLSPFALREKLSSAFSNKSSIKDEELPHLMDDDILRAFEEEDEMFNEEEYGAVGSPRCEKQYFKAEYDFNARSDLELSMHSGDIIALIMSHDTDNNSEWWFVSNSDGKQGYVPSNYLTKAEYL